MNRIFLFNSGLPEANQSQEDFLQSLGPSNGYFRGRNIGNGYIGYSVLKTLFGHAKKVDHLANAWEGPLTDELARKINETNSHFVFVMQDFIREETRVLPFDRLTQFLEKIKIPVVPVSLGANSFNGFDTNLANRLTNDQRRFLSLLSEKSAMIGVRGAYTAEILGRLGIRNVKVLGCPTFFESGRSRVLTMRPWRAEKVVTTGGFFNRKLPESRHILQDELDYVRLLFWPELQLDSRDPLSRPYDVYDLAGSFHLMQKAKDELLEFFPDYTEWEKFYDKNKFCLTIGSRLHSGIFSINRGVPAVVTNGDARARETCEFLSIPHRPELGRSSDIQSVFSEIDPSKMNDRYPALYDNYKEFLGQCGLSLAADDQRVAASAGESFKFPEVKRIVLGVREKGLIFESYTDLVERVSDDFRHSRYSDENFKKSLAGRIGFWLQKMNGEYPLAGLAVRSSLKGGLLMRDRARHFCSVIINKIRLT